MLENRFINYVEKFKFFFLNFVYTKIMFFSFILKRDQEISGPYENNVYQRCVKVKNS